MENESNDLNLAQGQDTQGEKSGGMKKILIIVVGAVLLLAAGGGAVFMFTKSSEPEQTVAVEGEPVVTETEPEPDEDPIFVPLAPAFVINFETGGRTRYLQIELEAMSYDQDIVDKVKASMPAVRNGLIMLFSAQDYELLTTVEGKETLRQEALAAVNQSIRATTGPKIEDVFFTAFVMQ